MNAVAFRRRTWRLNTPRGPGRLIASLPEDPVAVLLLGHGAGGGIDAFDLEALAARLPESGVAVVRFEQPWRTAGKKVASPPAWLDEGWLPAIASMRRRWSKVPLFVGGHSAGARVACRCFDSSMAGVVALSFPLHPPGKPEKSRLPELASVTGPLLVVQGATDPFGSASDVRTALDSNVGRADHDMTVIEIAAAGHSLQPGKRSGPEAAAELIVSSVASFIASH